MQAKLAAPEHSNVAAGLQRLVFKGTALKDPGASLVLVLGGGSGGGGGGMLPAIGGQIGGGRGGTLGGMLAGRRLKMVLLGNDGLYRQEDESSLLATAAAELAGAGAAVERAARLLDHRGIGPAEAAIEIGAAEATVRAVASQSSPHVPSKYPLLSFLGISHPPSLFVLQGCPPRVDRMMVAQVEALRNRLETIGAASAAERAVRQGDREKLKRQAEEVTAAIEAARRKLKLHKHN